MAKERIAYILHEIENSNINNNDIFDDTDLGFLQEYLGKYTRLIEARSDMAKYPNIEIMQFPMNTFEDVARSVRKISKKNRDAAKLSHVFKKPHFKAFIECLKEISNGEHIPIPYNGELFEVEIPEEQQIQMNVQTRQFHKQQDNSESSEEDDEEGEEEDDPEEVFHRKPVVQNQPQLRKPKPQQSVNNELQIIGLHRDKKQPLGITVVKTKVQFNGVNLDRCVVERILMNSLIDKQGLINVGDVIFEVNDQPVEDPDVLLRIVSRYSGTVTFKVLKNQSRPNLLSVEKTFMKALFDYDPEQDPHLPSKSIGLKFKAGDVFQVINKDDMNYWQALPLDSSTNTQACLIPSQSLQESVLANQKANTSNGFGTIGRKKSKKAEIMKIKDVADLSNEADLRTYEEVTKFQASRAPCLVLTGAEGLGKKAMKEYLVSRDPYRFAFPLRDTSETPARKSNSNAHLNHVSKVQMATDIREGLYVCIEEKANNELSGIRISSIRELINQGKTVIIDCKPKDVYNLKTPIFNPFVVLVTTPSLQVLESLQKEGIQKNWTQKKRSQAELKHILDASNYFRSAVEYKGLVDCQVLHQSGIENTCKDLLTHLNQYESTESWIPVSWEYDITFLPPNRRQQQQQQQLLQTQESQQSSPDQRGVNSMQRRYEKKTDNNTINSRRQKQQIQAGNSPKNNNSSNVQRKPHYQQQQSQDDSEESSDEEDTEDSPKKIMLAKPVKFEENRPFKRTDQQQQYLPEQNDQIQPELNYQVQQQQPEQIIDVPEVKKPIILPKPKVSVPTKPEKRSSTNQKPVMSVRPPIKKNTHSDSSGISDTSSDDDDSDESDDRQNGKRQPPAPRQGNNYKVNRV